MKLALLSPKGPMYRHRTGCFGWALRYQPLTLTTLAALIPPDLDIEVRLIDESIRRMDWDLEADLVGITVITGNAVRAYEVADHFRRRGIPVVLGGPHITLAPDDARPHADAIVVGYAEETWPQLLRDFAAGRMQPRYDQASELSLAGRPFAKRHLLPRHRYVTAASFEAQRGCLHDCEFCVVPAAWGRRLFQKPVGEVVEDIRRSGKRKLLFVDLNMIADRAYAMELFAALVPLKIEWSGLVTVMFGDDESMLELAAKSGCRGVLMGLESVTRDGVRACKKGFNSPQRYRRIIEALHAHRIALNGCFVFGVDTDRPDVFRETAEFAIDARVDLPRYAIVTPFPATALQRRLEAEGRIFTRNWELYDAQHVVFRPARMSPEELLRGHQWAWRHTYRLAAIAHRLAASPMPRALAWGANLAYHRYAERMPHYDGANLRAIAEAAAAPASPARAATAAREEEAAAPAGIAG